MSSPDRENKRQRIENESSDYIPHYTTENSDIILDQSDLNTSTQHMDSQSSRRDEAAADMDTEKQTNYVDINDRPITDRMTLYLAEPEAYRLDPEMIHKAFEGVRCNRMSICDTTDLTLCRISFLVTL